LKLWGAHLSIDDDDDRRKTNKGHSREEKIKMGSEKDARTIPT
jgi:hypothetical protein